MTKLNCMYHVKRTIWKNTSRFGAKRPSAISSHYVKVPQKFEDELIKETPEYYVFKNNGRIKISTVDEITEIKPSKKTKK